jgi:hypothetical protein
MDLNMLRGPGGGAAGTPIARVESELGTPLFDRSAGSD